MTIVGTEGNGEDLSNVLSDELVNIRIKGTWGGCGGLGRPRESTGQSTIDWDDGVGQRRDDGVVPGREIVANGQLQPSVMKDSIGDKFSFDRR